MQGRRVPEALLVECARGGRSVHVPMIRRYLHSGVGRRPPHGRLYRIFRSENLLEPPEALLVECARGARSVHVPMIHDYLHSGPGGRPPHGRLYRIFRSENLLEPPEALPVECAVVSVLLGVGYGVWLVYCGGGHVRQGQAGTRIP
jgi:hypothetical protein